MSRSYGMLAVIALVNTLPYLAGCQTTPPRPPYELGKRLPEQCVYEVVSLGEGKYAVRVNHDPDPKLWPGYAHGAFDAWVTLQVTANRRTTTTYIAIDSKVDLAPIPSFEWITGVAHESCVTFKARDPQLASVGH